MQNLWNEVKQRLSNAVAQEQGKHVIEITDWSNEVYKFISNKLTESGFEFIVRDVSFVYDDIQIVVDLNKHEVRM